VDLILWRHAEAVDAAVGEDDQDRPLTSRGERQAARMAAWLNQYLPATTRVLVSPTRRTRQTAEALERRCKTVQTLGPEASVTALLAAARWPDAKEPVLVVGHQPTLGLTAAHLLAGVDQTWSVKKGAVWWLRSRQRDGDHDGSGRIVLVTVRGPENV
jgi:phosphohistidine phosphatase